MKYDVQVRDGGMWRRVATSRSLQAAFIWLRAFAVSSSARIVDTEGTTIAAIGTGSI